MVGSTISHYRILEKLGEGGMGVVYKAEDAKLRRFVALKFLPSTLLVNEDDRRRFVHEAQASAALSHPNIATVFEIDESEAKTFIALEYIEGETLAGKIKSGPLKLDDALSIAIQTCEGLQAAHEKGIVHRDIKCQNIMVTTKGQVKILDFGLAKLRGASVVTKAGSTLGTMGYMSPEQLRGETVDQRTDIWAVGVVLYEMIAGRRPFRGDYEGAVSYQVMNQQPEPLTAIRSGVPMELERIVNKLLQKDSGMRYQSATDLLVDLRAVPQIPGPSGSGPTRPAASSVVRPFWRRKGPLAAAALLLVGIASAYYYVTHGGASDIRSLAVLPFENLSGDPDQEYFADEMTDQLITELSKIHSLRVISRRSAMVFKNRHELLPAIGKALNVEALITATVLRSGDRVRVNAQLVRASNEENLWSDSYEQKLEGILDLQSTLARSITQRISLALTPEERSHMSQRRPVSPRAFDLVARGNYLLSSSGDDARFIKAYEMMREAVAIDSTYVDAQVGLALSIVFPGFWGITVQKEESEEAERALATALKLDPSSGRAHTALGQLRWLQGDLPACILAHKQAFDLNPRDGFIVTNYSWMLMIEGKYAEGVAEGQKAVELDPLAQYARCNLMGWYYAVRRFADAEAEAHRILGLDSTWEPALFQLALIAEHEGRFEQARELWLKDFQRRGIATKGAPPPSSWPTFCAWRSETLERLGLLGDLVYSLLLQGDNKRAMAVLEVCIQKRESIVLLLFNPDFDPLRNEPRFAELIAQIQLPVNAYCALPRK
jgi:TolB-like protein/predicted Ser/Thr protein kinase